MQEIDFLSPLHKSTKRDYISRVTDKSYPKEKAAELAKKFDYDLVKIVKELCNIKDDRGKPLIKETRLKTIKKRTDSYKEIYYNMA